MKTLNVKQLCCILSFHQECKALFKDDVLVAPVSHSYDFRKNRYSLKFLYVALVESVNEFDDAKKKMFCFYEFTTTSTYDATEHRVNCRPIQFIDADDFDVVITDQKLIDNVVPPFIREKGGVQKCVDGLDEEEAVADVEADESMLGCPVEAYVCNDSPFSNTSLE